jgi:NAD(P)-dependent dehydrogenase (short-subunit alcohol dehydrogenase family)
VTVIGGALGFMNLVQGAPEHGAVAGLLKAVRRELGLQVQLLDSSPSSTPAQIAAALLAELDAGSPRLEVGLLRSKRVRLAMAPASAPEATAVRALPAAWVVTGGARGITAQVARRLAALHQPALHLIGRHPLPDPDQLAGWRSLAAQGGTALRDRVIDELRASSITFTPRDLSERLGAIEKSLEIDRNLRAIVEAGSSVHYYAVDLADREAVAAALDAIRAAGRPIEGLIHGAGVEIAKSLDKKTAPIVQATLGGKLDGLVHLLALTERDPLQQVIAFSSVSGRFGGHGQSDYAMANEAMARILGAYRATHPKVRAAALTWPAWSEVGLAARSSAKTFLEQTGQRFMSPEEGVNHLLRELWAGLPEAEVVFADHLDALDLDRLLVPAGGDFDRVATRLASSPLLSRLVLLAPDAGRAIAEREVSSGEAFLDQHRMGATPILPAVIGLEVMSELLAAEGDGSTLAEVQIHQPMKVPEGARVLLRAEREGEAIQLTATAIKPDGVVLEPDRVYFSAKRVAKQGLPADRAREPFSGDAIPYPYPPEIDRTPGSRMIYHGPVFQCLRGIQPNEGGGRAQLVVPPVEALVRGALASDFVIPAALLDGCLQAAGFLGRMVHGLSALPIGFARIEVAARAVSATGRSVTLEIRQRREGESQLVSDLFAFDEEGPLLIVDAYRAQVVRGL